MFTPPPSPLPLPRIVVTVSDSDKPLSSATKIEEENVFETSLSLPASTLDRNEKSMQAVQTAAVETDIQNHWQKKRAGRRIRWAVLLVPAVLILVALTSRRIAVFDEGLDDISSMSGSRGDGDRLAADEPFIESGMEVKWTGGGNLIPSQSSRHDQIHHPKRQTLSLTNPAAPSSTILISSIPSPTSTDAASGSASASGTGSPTTTVPETEQTIPPVPNSSSPPALPTPFPQPYDSTGATSNLTTQSCVNFFTNMTQQLAFRSCRPFSLLEQFSEEFIESQTNLTLLNTLIFGTCTTTIPFDTCITNMDWFASSLSSSCSTELRENNAQVLQTLLGLQSYSLLRNSACLIDQQSNTYCYASAAHAASPADLYYYQLPLGVAFPVATTQPSCSTCTKSLLALYAEAMQSGNSSAAGLKDTYEGAADQAESVCGSGFATVGLATSGVSGSVRTKRARWVDRGMSRWGVALGGLVWTLVLV